MLVMRKSTVACGNDGDSAVSGLTMGVASCEVDELQESMSKVAGLAGFARTAQ